MIPLLVRGEIPPNSIVFFRKDSQTVPMAQAERPAAEHGIGSPGHSPALDVHPAPHVRVPAPSPADHPPRVIPRPHFLRGRLDDDIIEITEISESLATILGGPGMKIVGSTPWLQFIPEDEIPHVEELVARTIAGESWADRLRVVTPAGQVAVFDVYMSVRPAGDGTQDVFLSLRDISPLVDALTAVAERDARLRILTAEVPLVLWTCDSELRIDWMMVSPLVRNVSGDLTGQSIEQLFGGAVGDAPAVAERAALQGERAAYVVEARGHRFRVSTEPRFDLFGTIIGTIGTAVVVGERGSSEVHAEMSPRRVPSAQQNGRVLHLGSLSIDPEQFIVVKDGSELPLTVTEFKLLMEFAQNQDRVLSREDLVKAVWSSEFTGSAGMVTMAVKRLRAKIEEDPTRPKMIETVRGLGYRLRNPSTAINGDE